MIRRGLALWLVAVLVTCTGPPQKIASIESPEPLPTQRDVPIAFASRYAAAQTATTLFHVRFDQRSFARIYSTTDDGFRASTKETELTARLSALRDRVGMSREEMTFDSATLTETFVWRVTPSEMTFLVRYEAR